LKSLALTICNSPRADLGFTVSREHHQSDFALTI
jgi:hypothetical protein